MNRIAPRVTLRIPGEWSHPRELLERLPDGFELTPEALMLPDGTSIEFIPMPPDDEFPGIFESSCRRPPTDEERAILSRYAVNVGLKGPGGSLEAARTMMQAGAAIVRAGGAGVFNDNSGLAHGGGDWLELTEDGSSDAVSFAFAAIIEGRVDAYTMGLQVLGFPDLSMRRGDMGEDGEMLIELIRYVCRGERSIDVGHLLADEQGPRFQVVSREQDEFEPDSPMHNPFGRFKIVSLKDVAEGN